jgi:hypothetical protein
MRLAALLVFLPLRGVLCALLAHYTFDTDFRDSSGFGNDGVGVGAGVGIALDPARGGVLNVSAPWDQLRERHLFFLCFSFY